MDTGTRGNLPSNVFHQTNMRVLFLGGNENLTVSLPKLNCSISNSLRQLDLSHTSFSAELPDLIGCMWSLNYLDLRFCQISGVIPESIGNLTQLTELHLGDNYLRGNIPDKFSILQKISRLSLGHHLLSGNIPISLLNLKHLEHLDLSSNQLSRSIPPSIFTILTLSYLDLSSNLFTGVRQDLFVDSNKLQNKAFNSEAPWNTIINVSISYSNFMHLGLSSCQIKEFPEFLRNSERLDFLDHSNNMIRSKIPSWFMSKTLDKLFSLKLSHNFLTGTIDHLPVTPQLEFLDLSSNSLQGPIPSFICNASLLRILDLSNNNLSGPIPQCLGNSSQYLEIMDLGNNRLFGTIPTTFSEGNSLQFCDGSTSPLGKPEGSAGRLLSSRRDSVVQSTHNTDETDEISSKQEKETLIET